MPDATLRLPYTERMQWFWVCALLVAPAAAQTPADSHHLKLAAGDFFHVVVEERGAHVKASVVDSVGKEVVASDIPSVGFDRQYLSGIAEKPGEYTVEIAERAQAGQQGAYQIEETGVHAATANDRALLRAEQMIREGLTNEAAKEPGAQDRAIERYTEAAKILDGLKERREQALALTRLALVYNTQENRQKALEALNQLWGIEHDLDDARGQANADFDTARTYSKLGDVEKAFEHYARALPLFHEVGERSGEATTMAYLAEIYRDRGENQKALDLDSQALPLHRAVGDRLGEANSLLDLGDDFRGLGEKETAIDYYSQAAPVYRALGRASDEADALGSIGDIFLAGQQYRKALEVYQQALPARQAGDDRNLEANVLSNIAAAFSGVGEKEKALDYLTRAAPIYRAAKNAAGEASVMGRVAEIAVDLGERQKALGLYDQALAAFRALGDRAGEAGCLGGIARVRLAMGETQTALDLYQQAVGIIHDLGNRAAEASILTNIGEAYAARGEVQKALNATGQALAILRATGNQNGEAETLEVVGQFYSRLAQPQKAVEYYNRALTIFQTLGDANGQASSLHDLGLGYDEMGDRQKALEYYQSALPLIRSLGDRALEASLLNNLGLVYHELGDKQKAIDFYVQSMPLRQAVGDVDGESITMMNVGLLAYAGGLKDLAIESLMQSLGLAEQVGDPDHLGTILSKLMYVWEIEKNPELAIFFGKEAVNQFQKIRKNIRDLDKGLQQSYSDSVNGRYRELADLLISQGRLPEAERVLGLLKEQEFLQFTRGVNPKTSETQPITLNPAETQAESITAEAMEWFGLRGKDERSPVEETRMTALTAKLSMANDTMTSFARSLQQVLGKEAQGHARQVSMETSDSQSLLRDLPKGNAAVAVYTVVLENELDLIVVSPAVMSPHKVPIRRADLSRMAQTLLAALKNPGSDPRKAAADLYNLIVAPIAGDLKGAKADTIAWSLDDVLRYIPMNALYDAGSQRYLVEEYANVLFNSASMSRLKEAPQLNRWTALGMGISKQYDADLPALDGVPGELDAVVRDASVPGSAGVIPGRILLDAAFTEKAMADQLWQKYPLVHIASHFVLDPASDDNSWLLLAGKDKGEDGYKLRLAELRSDPNLDFHSVELLTLSACETAVASGASDGREVDSLSLLAQEKGAKAVLATLWAANDASASALMADFYRRWTEGKGLRKIESLRQAQIAMLHGKYAHPYYWAAFILMGNWQ